MSFHLGHVLDVLPQLASASVHCVITSPPYWGARNYEGDQAQPWPDGWHGALGHESTPELYIDHTLQWLMEVWRVLRPDGVVWLNLGDSSYSGGNPQDAKPETSGLRGGPNWGGIKFQPSPHPVLKPKDAILIP